MPTPMPPMMYQVVVSVKRPVNVSLIWSAIEFEACMPMMKRTIPTTSRTIPMMRGGLARFLISSFRQTRDPRRITRQRTGTAADSPK